LKSNKPKREDFLIPKNKAEHELMVDRLIQVGFLQGEAEQIIASINTVKPRPTFSYRKKWSRYYKIWNNFGNKILEVINNLVPLTSFSNNIATKQTLPASIKSKINLGKRLITL
jgi:hypothetical protein